MRPANKVGFAVDAMPELRTSRAALFERDSCRRRGLKDRRRGSLRIEDYGAKLRSVLRRHGELEAAFPKHDVLAMLESPKEFVNLVAGARGDEEVRRQIMNSLDLFYFWMLQPRARPVFKRLMEEATARERQIVLRTQRLLERQKLISKLLLDGLTGRNFAPALAFYLDKSPVYLRDMARLAAEIDQKRAA